MAGTDPRHGPANGLRMKQSTKHLEIPPWADIHSPFLRTARCQVGPCPRAFFGQALGSGPSGVRTTIRHAQRWIPQSRLRRISSSGRPACPPPLIGRHTNSHHPSRPAPHRGRLIGHPEVAENTTSRRRSHGDENDRVLGEGHAGACNHRILLDLRDAGNRLPSKVHRGLRQTGPPASSPVRKPIRLCSRQPDRFLLESAP